MKTIPSIFYGYNELGSFVFSIFIFVSLFFNLYTVTSSTLQSLNKFKAVYFSSLLGFILNGILDIPLMLLFHFLGFAPWIGAFVATVIGYSTSIYFALLILKKANHLSYQSVIRLLKKLIFPLGSMIIVVLILRSVLPVNYLSKFSCILNVAIISIVGAFVYLYLCFKIGLIRKVFGKDFCDKISKKLTRKRVSH